MPLITWTSDLSVQLKEMDAQHMILIDLINQLHEAMRSGKGAIEVGVIINRMIEYAQNHFKAEEKLMSANYYPGYNRQKAEHESFIKKALEFKQDFNEGKLALSVTVINFLKVWLVNHIRVEDKSYGPFLNSKGIV